ncbi:hypothetical protein Tco_0327401 [Tanacetum coccineum]
MKESKAYKTYLGYATGKVPPKVARKFKKASPSKKESELVPGDEEPVKKGKRLKTPAKKSASKPATGIVIRVPPVETKSKRKEKRKGGCSSWKSLSEWNKQENESEEQELDSEQDEESDDDDQEQEEINQENEYEDDEMKRIVQGEGNDAVMTEAQQGNENLETTQEQVIEDVHVTISTVPKKTKVPVTSSSRLSDLACKFLNFLDIPQTDAEKVSPLDVHVHHEVPRTQAPTLLTIQVLVIPESSPVFTNIPQSSYTFTPTPIQATPTPLPIIETTNPLSNLPDFSSVFRFNDRITTLEKEVADLKKDPLHTQVTSLVDSHLDTRLGETRQEFMNFLSESLSARIKEQVKDQLPQILPQEVSSFAPPVIEKLIKESRDEVTLAKDSDMPQRSRTSSLVIMKMNQRMRLAFLDVTLVQETYRPPQEPTDQTRMLHDYSRKDHPKLIDGL